MRLVIALVMVMAGVFVLALLQADNTTPERAAAPTVSATYAPGREPIELPLDYRDSLVHYATIDRIDGTSRDLYISPQAIDAINNGLSVPERTLVLIEAFETSSEKGANGHLLRAAADPEVHVAEARSTWQIADLAATSRVGDWNFGAFDGRDGSVVTETGLNDCFSCHEGASTRNFLFSEPLIEAFIETGEVQYVFCRRSGRSRCF